MKIVALTFVWLISFVVATVAYADTTIEMLNKRADGEKMAYSIDVVWIDAGETITWIPTSKGHNVEFVAYPDGADVPKKSKNNKEVSVQFDTPGMYYYWCTPHKGMGMIGLVIVGGDTSNKEDIADAKALGKSKKKLKALLAEID